ncbi:MAG: MarC family protein [Betaproteobacteria bacterium]|nr:MAG: MarC family protein [Betaproteobacteria bacterium]
MSYRNCLPLGSKFHRISLRSSPEGSRCRNWLRKLSEIDVQRRIGLLVALTTWIALRAATQIGRRLGKIGINVVIRIMGLLLAAVAVEIFASGIVVLLPGLGK